MRRVFVRPAWLLVTFWLLTGCASSPPAATEQREQIEAEIQSHGLGNQPAIEAQRAEVEAAVAREDDSPVIDGFEIRAAAVHETDDKMQLRARLPFDNLFGASAKQDARRAGTEEALARLAETTLVERVRMCRPSLDRLVHEERLSIYGRYAERQKVLLERNDELKRAGRLDEVRAMSFELSQQVDLALAEPEPPTGPSGGSVTVAAVLPEPTAGAPELSATPEVIHEQLRRHQPAVGVHQARGRHYDAMARSEAKRRLPTLKFVDFAVEPVAYPGDDRQYEAQVAFEIPFGRAARAGERQYAALARGQRSAERALILDRGEQARAAVETINWFRRRGAHWLGLRERADQAEAVADRWWKSRLAEPKAIAGLLDEVQDARLAVLDARERAGRAACTVLASTGLSVDEWPQ